MNKSMEDIYCTKLLIEKLGDIGIAPNPKKFIIDVSVRRRVGDISNPLNTFIGGVIRVDIDTSYKYKTIRWRRTTLGIAVSETPLETITHYVSVFLPDRVKAELIRRRVIKEEK